MALDLVEHSSKDVRPSTVPCASRFSFGGVDIELLGCERFGNDARLPAHFGECMASAIERSGVQPVAQLTCSVWPSPSEALGGEMHRARWSWEHAGRASLQLRWLEAELRKVDDMHWCASASLMPRAEAWSALLTSLSAAVIQACGGAVLHAAGVERDRHAVLFVGHSGSGKSTACAHVRQAPRFAFDRVAVVPSRSGWWAWRLPGGKDWGEPINDVKMLPLAAILGIEKATGCPRIETPNARAAQVMLRQCMFASDGDVMRELERLKVAESLVRRTRVGVAYNVLGAPLNGALTHWLDGRPGVVSGARSSRLSGRPA